MKLITTATLLLTTAISFASPVRAGEVQPELQLDRALGGTLAAPAIIGNRVYLPTGRIISSFDYGDFSAPRMTGDTSRQPAAGRIVSITHYGPYLYAAWDTYADNSGISIYSIRDPDAPNLVAEFQDYTASSFRNAQAIIAVDDFLYLFDSENGIFVAPLSKPEAPAFELGTQAIGAWQQTYRGVNRIHTSGRNLLGLRELQVIDVETPMEPVSIGAATLDPFSNFSLAYDKTHAFGFGYGFSIHDVSDPTNIETVFTVDDGRVNFQGFVNGNYAYAIGNTDIQPWNIGDITKPLSHKAESVDTFATAFAMPFGRNALLLSQADRMIGLDLAKPEIPQLASEAIIKGAVDGYDIGFVGNTALILQNTYGLHVADAQSFETIGRLEIDLPPVLQQRAFEQMHIEGETAYLSSWGAGLFMVDVSDPAHPVEIGHWSDQFTSTVDVAKDIAVVGRSTNSGGLSIIDVSNPSRPVTRSTIDNVDVAKLRILDSNVLVADGESGIGMRLFDISDVDAPVEVGQYSADCGIGIAIDVDERQKTAFLLCAQSGLHVIDVSDPSRPTNIGKLDLGGSTNIGAVTVLGNRAYVAGDRGFSEIDIGNPSRPVLLARHPLASSARSVRIAPDGRVIVMGGESGLHVFKASDSVFADGFDGSQQ